MTAVRVQVVTIRCEDCGIESEVEAEIWSETEPGNPPSATAYWTCPTTWCDRTFIDPRKTTEWTDR